ncbi:hypothetical protein GCM10020331_084860 [Ectobacillus funiculus]
MHEAMITEHDARHTIELDTYYVIQPEFPWWSYEDEKKLERVYLKDLNIRVTRIRNGSPLKN